MHFYFVVKLEVQKYSLQKRFRLLFNKKSNQIKTIASHKFGQNG